MTHEKEQLRHRVRNPQTPVRLEVPLQQVQALRRLNQVAHEVAQQGGTALVQMQVVDGRVVLDLVDPHITVVELLRRLG